MQVLIIGFFFSFSDKNAFDGLKWTNEKKSKLTKKNDVCDDAIDEKKCGDGGCSDTNISMAEQNTSSTSKEKVNLLVRARFRR